MNAVVCFIRPKERKDAPVYIGQTDDPRKLREMLQAANPEELVLLGAVDARLYPLSWWEDVLSPWRIRGAWYQPKAQVLCRVEDALTGKLEAPGRIDPLEDDDGSQEDDAVDRIPVNLIMTRAERARLKWAWPEVDPYPSVPLQSIRPSAAVPVLKAVLGKLGPRSRPQAG